jgi:hypothetical protein
MQLWAKERSFLKYFERKARYKIVEAARKDLETPILQKEAEELVVSLTEKARNRIRGKIDEKGNDSISIKSKDNTFITRFRREPGDILVAEEVLPESLDVISQARVYPDGRTELTLNFKGKKFEDPGKGVDRNPRIFLAKNLPRAASKVFNLLVGAVK